MSIKSLIKNSERLAKIQPQLTVFALLLYLFGREIFELLKSLC